MSFRRYLIEIATDDWTHEGWHGTPDARGIKKDGFRTLKQRYDKVDEKPVYWAAKEHKVAKSYADPHRAFDYQNSEPATLPVQMKMKNPKTIHWGGKKFHDKDEHGNWHHIDHHIEAARDAGHDGVVIHGVRDDYQAKGKASTIYAVFHHDNIRVKK